MRKTANYEMNLLDADDFYNEASINENAERVDEILKQHENPEYDVSEKKEVEELTSGESLKVAFRKLARAVADYISHKADEVAHITEEEREAWNAKLGEEKIANNLTTNVYGKVLDAYQGKNLLEKINDLTTTQDGSVQTNINWNTIKIPGLFRYLVRADDTSMNAPELNTPFYIVVIKKNDKDLEQWAYSAVSNARYTRVCASGTWGEWANIITSEHISNNFVTENWKMIAAAPLVKQLYEKLEKLKTENSYEIWTTYPNYSAWGAVYGQVHIPEIKSRIESGTTISIRCAIYNNNDEAVEPTEKVDCVVHEDWIQVRVGYNAKYSGKPMVFRIGLN